MKNLYIVNVTCEGFATMPVAAESESEAEAIAEDSVSLIDLHLETYATASQAAVCPKWCENKRPEGLDDNRTCAEFLATENKERARWEMEESWPKLPGFENVL